MGLITFIISFMSFMSEVLLQLAKWGHEHDFGVNILKLLLRPSHQYIDILNGFIIHSFCKPNTLAL